MSPAGLGTALAVAGLAAVGLGGALGTLLHRVAARHGRSGCPGGAAVAAGALLPALVLAPRWDARLWVTVTGAVLVVVIGLAEELGGIPALSRLLVVSLAAVAVAGTGARLPVFAAAGAGTGAGAVADAAVTVLWIVAVTTAFGLLGSRGRVTAAVAAAAGLVLGAGAAAAGWYPLGLLLVTVAGAGVGVVRSARAPAGTRPDRAVLGTAAASWSGFLVAAATVLLAGAGGTG